MISCRMCLAFAGCLFISAISGLPLANQKSTESPGKPGEKSLRSLDQVSYQDGVNRARSDFIQTDSYGNPVNYDSLEAIDARKPSKQADPNKFIIPGYASGILRPHEVPTRSNFNGETGRTLGGDDRIHFIDPFQNAQPSPNLLAPPFGTAPNPNVLPSQAPIDIPRPNINAPETPQAPEIDDPLNHILTPPQNDDSGGSPLFSSQEPIVNLQQPALAQGLIPPQAPSQGPGINIPRPNLDASETPIDNSNGPLNQGLLPPTDSSSLSSPTFANGNQDGPVIITDANFAPKPSNGLLPPKDVSPNEINYQSNDGLENTQPTASTVNKFSFGGAPGILGQAAGAVAGAVDKVQNKFTGSFGGSQGVLGGAPVNQIPVVVVQGPFNPPPRATPTIQTFASQAPKATVDKYQGSFGGSPGVLSNNNAQIQPLPTLSSPPVSTTFASQSSLPSDKFSGSFGGASGVLGGSKPASSDKFSSSFGGAPGLLGSSKPASSPLPLANPTTQTFNQLLNVSKDTEQKEVGEKYTGSFGGAPGILRPYDN